MLQNQIVDDLEKLIEKIDRVQAKHTRYRIIRFGGACLTGVVAIFVAQVTLIQLINYFLQGSPAKLRDQIDHLLPPRADGDRHSFVEDDIVSADVLFPAWDFGKGRPILFSKTMAAHMNEKKPGDQPVYNANLNAGVLASAANVAYFGSANISWADSNGLED